MKNLIILLFLLTANALIAQTQNLPGVKEKSVSLTTAFKVDGKLAEWDNKLQAYDKSIDAYYTLANNAENIYLAIQATDPAIIKKILSGGITLTICTSGQKNDPNAYGLTFPNIPEKMQAGVTSDVNQFAEKSINQDSLCKAINKNIASFAKEIKLKGFSLLTIH